MSLKNLTISEIPLAFEQLAYVQQQRREYRDLIERMQADGSGKVKQKAFVVSNGRISKPMLEKLERHHGLRVAAILHSVATTPIPDLRKYL